MFKITTILALLALGMSYQAKAQSYVYQLEVNENELYLPKEIIDVFNRQMVCSNMTYFTHNDFLFMSSDNRDEDFFRTILNNLGLQLVQFEKTRTVNDLAMEKAGGSDCDYAELLCSNASMNANSSGFGLQELNSSNNGCLSVEHQSSWYYINIGTGGNLTMVIDPANNSDDYDFAIWGPFTPANAGTNCPPVSSPIRCSWSDNSNLTGMSASGYLDCFLGFIGDCNANSEGAGGNSWVQQLNVSSNQIYIMLVDNFSNSGQPYNLSWGGSAVLNCTPVVLPIEMAAFSAQQTGRYNSIKWQTMTELNNDYFVVQRSADGMTWTDLGEIDGAGQSAESHNYEYMDKDFSFEINYYRIMQVDFDGTKRYSWIEKVDNSLSSKTIDRMVNLMGQEVDENYQGMRVVIYTDGTIIRKY